MKRKEPKVRPVLFIGTTTEGLPLGEALYQNLKHRFEVLVWKQGAFQPSHSVLGDLLRRAETVDYAAFVLTPDDTRRSRGRQAAVPRDNLIFELGLFMGALGRDRVFAIVPVTDPPDLPSDLDGITMIRYDPPEKLDWQAAMGSIVGDFNKILELHAHPGGDKADPQEKETHRRQIAVCSIEATFRGHVPLRDISCVVSCLEEALKTGLDSLKHGAELSDKAIGNGDHLLRRELRALWEHAVVSLRNSTATVVWEMPQGREGKKLEIGLALMILDFVSLFQGYFRKCLSDLGLPFREHLEKVGLRVALSTGEALLRRSNSAGTPDYMGPCVEEADVLRRAIAPGEFIANLRLAPYLFMERLCAEEGRPDCVRVGIDGETCPVWIASKRLLRRRPKQRLLDSLSSVLDWAERPYDHADHAGTAVPPLTEDDLTSVFVIREVWESRFAAELSARVLREKDGQALIQSIEDTVKAMQSLSERNSNAMKHPDWRHYGAKFHSQIAELSSPGEEDARRRFTEWIYKFTKAVYSRGMVDSKDHSRPEEAVVIEEHRHILNLIRSGLAEDVGGVIKEHLVQHYGRARDAFLKCAGNAT